MIPTVLKEDIIRLRNEVKTDEAVEAELLKLGWPKKSVEAALNQKENAAIISTYTTEPKKPNTPTSQTAPATLSTQTSETTPSTQITTKQSSGYVQGVLGGDRKFRVFLVGLLIGLLSSIYPSYQAFKYALPIVKSLETRVKTAVDELFPENLEITIENGHASTNVTEPYYLTISQSTIDSIFNLNDNGNQPTSIIRLLTLNTQGSVEDFESFQSYAMLTSQSLVTYSDGDIKVTSLSKAPNMKITKSFIYDKIYEYNSGQKLTRFLTIVVYLTPLFVILSVALFFIGEVFLDAIIVYIITKIIQVNIPFKRVYAFCGLLVFIPFLITTNIRFVGFLQPYFLWLNTFFDVVVLSVSYVLISEYKSSTS